jgi:hypothetical protein
MDAHSAPKEFEEIGSSGGKIDLKYDAKHGGVSLGFSHSGPGGCSLFQLGVALDGSAIEYRALGGLDMRPPKKPTPVVPVFIISDEELMWGRSCPVCKSYFRTNRPSEIQNCPYCGHQDINPAFTTKNQLQFIDGVREAWLKSFTEKKDVTIELDVIAKSLPENRPAWVYSEERQQNRYSCRACKTSYDILGEYAGCPTCGRRNSIQVFEQHITKAEEEFKRANAELKDRHEREVEWEKLTRCVSDFEAMANDIRGRLLLFPNTPKRKEEIGQISFQQLGQAHEKLTKFFGIGLLDGFSETDTQFLIRMVNRRHLFVHKGGRVDQEYLDRTSDTAVKLHQKLSVRSNEIERLIPLLRRCANLLFSGFEAIRSATLVRISVLIE